MECRYEEIVFDHCLVYLAVHCYYASQLIELQQLSRITVTLNADVATFSVIVERHIELYDVVKSHPAVPVLLKNTCHKSFFHCDFLSSSASLSKSDITNNVKTASFPFEKKNSVVSKTKSIFVKGIVLKRADKTCTNKDDKKEILTSTLIQSNKKLKRK